jgi:hypothetical protein
MTQRRLDPDPPADDAAPPEGPRGDDDDVAPVAEPTAAPAAPLDLGGPSDTELRKRQAAWFAERARHEALRRPPPTADGSTSST